MHSAPSLFCVPDFLPKSSRSNYRNPGLTFPQPLATQRKKAEFPRPHLRHLYRKTTQLGISHKSPTFQRKNHRQLLLRQRPSFGNFYNGQEIAPPLTESKQIRPKRRNPGGKHPTHIHRPPLIIIQNPLESSQVFGTQVIPRLAISIRRDVFPIYLAPLLV